MKNPALDNALAHFKAHAEATATLERLHRQAEAVSDRLSEYASATKPDFAAISRLHSERQHVADNIRRTAESIRKLETAYEKPGFVIYHSVNLARSLAEDAAVECVDQRLREDFPEPYIRAFVSRRHFVLGDEEGRACYVTSPSDAKMFAAFNAALPDLLRQIAQAEKRTAIYRAATASRSLPSQSALDAATPEEAKPTVIAPRLELTAKEEAEREDALMNPEARARRDLLRKAHRIAAQDGPDALRAFTEANPSIASYFQRTAAAA